MKNGSSEIISIAAGLILLMLSSCGAPPVDQDAVAGIERSKYLLLDDRIIEEIENASLVVGKVEKHPSNPLFVEDNPWEMRFDNLYGNVIYDNDDRTYKCWYSPFIVDHSSLGMTLEQRNEKYRPPKGREMGICYATSKDGIKWEKPDLGLVEYKGSKQNNIIWRGPHGAGIFKDTHDPDPSRYFKAIFQGLSVSFSDNGINWSKAQKCEGVSVAGDTHNNAFWAPTLGKYVGITRTWGEEMGREVARIESDDFVKWTKEEVVLKGTNKNQQTYAMPVFFYEGVYLGLVAIHEQDSDRVWTELTWSPDTKEWNRISPGTPLIPCSEVELDYDYGCVYACAYPVFLKDEIRLYYGGSDWLHTSWRNGSLCLATLRPDGFAGYVPVSQEGPASITTVPLPYSGQEISVSADVEGEGWIKVSVLNTKGRTIATASDISETISGQPLSLNKEIKGEVIQIKFEFENAKIYSFGLK